jgi:dGTPase
MDIRSKMLEYEKSLCEYACYDKDSVRLESEDSDIRGEFFRDSDRIIYCKSYLRYMNKTQVFTNNENDHVSR